MKRAGMGAALVGLLLPLVGCQKKPLVEQAAQPFEFRSLNLQQRDLLGQLTWSLTSPEARYDLGRKLAQTRDLQGLVYKNGRPNYQLSATSATMLNDGAVIQLEGSIRLRRLGPRPLTVVARRARWYPNDQLIVLDQEPVGTQRNLRVSSRKARFFLAQNKLELLGDPLLEREPDGNDRPSNGRLRLQVKRADWLTESGELTGIGPVIGVRTIVSPKAIAGVGSQAGPQAQILTSPALTGNSQRQVLTLQAPVRLVDTGRKASLDALQTEIDIAQELIQSSLPFQGVLNQSQVTGVGFQIFGKSQLAVVRSRCLLRQPTDSLQADRCQWNWSTNQVQARGRVVLKRQANQQITTGERIDGTLGDQGLIVFTSPGRRVNTQLKLKSQSRPVAKSADQGLRNPGGSGPPIQL